MINYKVSKTCHVQFPFLLTLTWGPDIVFKKLNIANCFFFNIFSEDLYFNALIIGLFYICLVTDQILGEDGGGGGGVNPSNGGQAPTKEGDHFL